MESSDEAELDGLRLVMQRRHAATVAWREQLVERLGDHLCGSEPGPASEEVHRLSLLERAEQRASKRYARFLMLVSLKRDWRRPDPQRTVDQDNEPTLGVQETLEPSGEPGRDVGIRLQPNSPPGVCKGGHSPLADMDNSP